MTISSKAEVEKLQETLRQCGGDVWIENIRGERVDLKDELGFFQGVAKLIGNDDGEYELFARRSEDECRLMDFCFWQTRKAG